MDGESGEHRRLERFNFDSESYSLPCGNDVAFVIIVAEISRNHATQSVVN